MSDRLLPPDSGPATKALAYTFDTARRLEPLVPRIKNIGLTDIPDDWVPWLVYEYGLEDIVGYVRTFRQALTEGPIWQQRRGTPDGIRIGIGWVESEGEVDPPDGRHNWWQFQVGFAEPPSSIEQLRQLDGIINLSKAAEDELFRMFSPDADFRPGRMDVHRADVGNLYDGYSGVRRWEGGPLLSFGRNESFVIDASVEVESTTSIVATEEVTEFEGIRFDIDRDGAEIIATVESSYSYETTSEPGDTLGGSWPQAYPTGNWEYVSEIETIPTPWETL